MFKQNQTPYCIWVLLTIAGLFSLVSPYLLEARVYLDIDSPTVKRIPIVIPEIKNQGTSEPSLGNEASALLMHDIDFTGYFKIIDPRGFLGRSDEPGRIDFNAWALTGADLLVKGSYQIEGTQLRLELRLYDLPQGRQLLGKEYLISSRDYKKPIHRFAEEILFLLTGEHGFFQTKIAFVSTGTGKKEIYSADFDGNNFQRLTHHNSIALTPRWSPRGNEIAYTSYKDGPPSLYLLHIPGLQSTKISNRPGVNITPAWFPDGESLAIALNYQGNSEILQLNRSGATIRKLTQSWGIDVSPSWSPDGKQMAFVSNRSGSPQIYLLNVDSREVRRLTFQGNYNVGPVWSPKGNLIAYAGRVGGQFQIFTISPSGGEPLRLTTSGNNEAPDFSPDGRIIIFSSNRHGKSAIYAMNANGANQRRITFLSGEQFSPSWGLKKFDE
ncbi:MAG: Tol-Pal system beta propeller repeat protein TolB [Desulfobacca sp.]|nr:Tol-Pal system beta propeller repeat protein TolB [Desulfobacca sp.]